MALCLDFFNATKNGFFLNDQEFQITHLYETEDSLTCCIFDVSKKKSFKLHLNSFAPTVFIDGHPVDMWLGKNTHVNMMKVSICFNANKDDVRILTKSVYKKINKENVNLV